MLTDLAVPYADTAAAALRWSSRRPAGPALDVLVLERPGVRLDLCLLGASHSAVLTTRGGEVVETVACPPVGEAGGEPLPEQRVRVVGGSRYAFSSRVLRLDPAGLSRLAATLREAARDRDDRLAGVFPGAEDALTVLAGQPSADAATWWTWHLYPATGEAVHTSTAVRW